MEKMIFKNFFSSKKKINNIVVGLGNPGEKYKNTRHNAGFMAIDFITKSFNIEMKMGKFNSEYGFFEINEKKILILKPQTYMNLSGESVLAAMNFYKVPCENILVILDDINLAVGRIRIRENGSHGGHNGMKNILSLCGNCGFPRIKIGVGTNLPNFPLDRWVTSSFSESEHDLIFKICPYVKDAVIMMIQNDISRAMSCFNGINLKK